MKKKRTNNMGLVLSVAICVLFVATTFSGATEKFDFEEEMHPSTPKVVPWHDHDWDYWTNSPDMYAIPTGNIGIGTESPNALLEIGRDNTKPALLLTHPDATDELYDYSPISALKINAPPTAITRNFVSGIWVETNGALIDKGRGIFVHNLGKSDGIYVQQDGSSGTGLGILLTNNSLDSTGAVIGTLRSGQQALVLRQETSINPAAQSSSLLTVEASGSATEMVRLNSDVSNQVGIISRMTGGNSLPFVAKDGLDNNVFAVSNAGHAYFAGIVGIGTPSPESTLHVNGAINLDPVTEPGAPSTGFVLYCDAADGQLKAKSSAGTVTVLANP